MMLYHTTHQSNADDIIAQGFRHPGGDGVIGGGVWCCDAPYWEPSVFAAEGKRATFGYFALELDEAQIEEFKAMNEDLGVPEWEIPYDIVNAVFTDRTFHPFTE